MALQCGEHLHRELVVRAVTRHATTRVARAHLVLAGGSDLRLMLLHLLLLVLLSDLTGLAGSGRDCRLLRNGTCVICSGGILTALGSWATSDVFDHIDAFVEGEDAIFVIFDGELDGDNCDLRHEAAHYVAVFRQVPLEKGNGLQNCLVQKVEAHPELNNDLHCFAELVF